MLKLKNLDDIDFSKRKVGDLVFIGVYTSGSCNLRCKYCSESSGSKSENETSLDERIKIINQAKELGAEIVLIAGVGEPLIDSRFIPTIRHAHLSGLGTLLYTNALEGESPNEIKPISLENAKYLWEHNVSPIIKLESLVQSNHDFLTETNGSYSAVMESIKRLHDVGYKTIDGDLTRIGISALYTRKNLNDLKDLKKWCDNLGIRFSADFLRVYGNAEKNKIIIPTINEILEIKKELGDELPISVSRGCVFRNYGLIIDNIGNARYCAETATGEIGSIRDLSLSDLLRIKNSKYPPESQKCTFTCSLKLDYYLFNYSQGH